MKPGVPLDHLKWLGKYIVDQRPDVIVNLGDFSDMESLSSYDVGKKSFEGRRYRKDVDVSRRAMDLLLEPMRRTRRYSPRMVLVEGNHEHRVPRAVDADPKLEGTISIDDLQYKEAGWEVHPFLKPVQIHKVYYSHFFPSGVMGRPCTKASKLLSTYHVSCIAGHQQGREVAYAKRGDGKTLTAIIAGSFYQHDEEYLTPFANNCWKGVIVLHEVRDGQFDEMFVSMNYLRRKYGR